MRSRSPRLRALVRVVFLGSCSFPASPLIFSIFDRRQLVLLVVKYSTRVSDLALAGGLWYAFSVPEPEPLES